MPNDKRGLGYKGQVHQEASREVVELEVEPLYFWEAYENIIQLIYDIIVFESKISTPTNLFHESNMNIHSVNMVHNDPYIQILYSFPSQRDRNLLNIPLNILRGIDHKCFENNDSYGWDIDVRTIIFQINIDFIELMMVGEAKINLISTFCSFWFYPTPLLVLYCTIIEWFRYGNQHHTITIFVNSKLLQALVC